LKSQTQLRVAKKFYLQSSHTSIIMNFTGFILCCSLCMLD